MISIIVICLLSIILLFISYLLILSLRRINQFETFILNIQQIIDFATTRMKQVDDSGHYESDDETGFFFQELKQLQETFDQLFETEEESTDA